MLTSSACEAMEARPVRALRVAVLSDAAPERNGVGAYYHDLVGHLADHLEHVELISPGVAGNGWQGRLGFPMPGDSTQRISLPPARRIARHLYAVAPQVVVVATPGPYGLLGTLLARRLGAELLVGFHTRYERLTGLYWNRALNLFSRSYFEVCNRIMFRSGSVVLANSSEMAAAARASGARAVERVGTPLHREFLAPPPRPLGRALTRVLFAGRLAAEKNVQAVLAAARAQPGRAFHIAGEGPMQPAIARSARELPNLHYRGWLSRERLREAMDAADLLVLPSDEEAFGTIALEALARGRNVLVSAACGILEWPELKRGLSRIRPGEGLAAAIERVAGLDHALRAEKARIGRESALAFNARTLDRWVQVLGRHGDE
jgi:glycosyltransferase involved in cell wall biosynthesis